MMKLARRMVGSRSGQSLIQVLISVAILATLMTAFSTFVVNQNTEIRALNEKLASADLERTLIASMADGTVCQYVMNNPRRTFDATKLPQTIVLSPESPLYAGVIPGSPPRPGPEIARVGELASPASSSLRISSISLRIESGSNGTYVGKWQIAYDPATAVRALRPASASTGLVVDDANPAAAAVVRCQGAGWSLGPYLPLTSLTFPGQTGSGSFISIPPPLPTAANAKTMELLSNPFVYTPRGSRLEVRTIGGKTITSNNYGQALVFIAALHFQPAGGPDDSVWVSSHLNAVNPGTESATQMTDYGFASLSVIPNKPYTFRLGYYVQCDPSTACPNSGTAAFRFWSPASFTIQEYY